MVRAADLAIDGAVEVEFALLAHAAYAPFGATVVVSCAGVGDAFVALADGAAVAVGIEGTFKAFAVIADIATCAIVVDGAFARVNTTLAFADLIAVAMNVIEALDIDAFVVSGA